MESYLILSMTTGAMDGWYFDYTIADMALTSLQEKYPSSEWAMMKLVSLGEDDGHPIVCDRMFHANMKSELD